MATFSYPSAILLVNIEAGISSETQQIQLHFGSSQQNENLDAYL
jgi:hypothetical protein